MRKIRRALPLCTVVIVGLVGCSNNDTTKNQNLTEDTGYHSTEKSTMVRKINFEGPMQNVDDKLYGKDDAYSKRDRNYHGHEKIGRAHV